MSETPSNVRRFVRAAWSLLSFQLIASIGAVGVTGWAAFHVQHMAPASEGARSSAPDGKGAQPGSLGQAPRSTDLARDSDGQGQASTNETGAGDGGASPAPVEPQNTGQASIAIEVRRDEGGRLFVAVLGSDPDGAGTEPPSFQWLRDRQPIPGATTASYRFGAADVDRPIAVRVHYVDSKQFEETVTSEPIVLRSPGDRPEGGPPERDDINTGSSSITIVQDATAEAIARLAERLISRGDSDSRVETQTLVAVLGPDPDGVGAAPPSFQWLRNRAPIPGVRTRTYRTGIADAGQQISVRADYVDGRGFTESVVSRAVTPPPIVD